MIIANFTDGYSTATAPGLYQWDYGQILEIHGLSLPPAVEVHFAIVQSTDDAKTRIGTTIDKVTKVAIPEFIVEQSGDAVAYIYISNTTSGKTVKKINMPITARQKPEAFDAPEDAQLFREAIEMVNAAADRAEDAEKSSEAWAHGHVEYPDRDEDNAAYYANLAHDNAINTSKDKKSVGETANDVNNIAMRVNADKEESEQYRLQAAQSAAAALESKNNSKASENASKKAMEDAQIAEGQAELFAEQSGNSADTAEQAKNLVMQIGREVTENKEYVDKKIDDFNVLHQQAVQDIDNAGNNQAEFINSAGQKALENIGTGIDPTFTQEGKAADAKATGVAIDSLKDDINEIDSILLDTHISLNRFDASLVTSENIFANKQLTGSGTLIDNTNTDVSPYLEIEPNKQYTMGLVPEYGSAYTPWYTLPTAIAFYDSTKTFISRVNSGSGVSTFTTPNNAKYYRFNIYRGVGITIPLLASRCMLVYGDTLPSGFSTYTGDSKTPKLKQSIQYSLNNGVITVTSGYGDGSIVVEFGRRGPNDLPDFRYITAEGRQKYNNSTDWHGPYIIGAVNNIDGDDTGTRTYTGGNHNYANTSSMDSTATARNLSLNYYADGKLIENNSEGTANIIEIKWTNRVQGYNTRKSDGTGREILEERHLLRFDGFEWVSELEIQSLEDVRIESYYGFQCAVTNYPTIYMVGAVYRTPFSYTEPHSSGNNKPNKYVAYSNEDKLEMEVDRSYDLGTGFFYGDSGTDGFRTISSGKGYTYLISQRNVSANAVYGARAFYRFMPND